MRALAVALTALVLLSQTARAQEAEKPKVVLWHAYRGAERTALEQLVTERNQDPRVPYTIDVLSIPYDALVDKITAAVPRNRGPDLFIFAHDTMGDWAEANILTPLDGKVEPTFLNNFFPETVPPLLYQGKLYALPLAFKSVALVYRKDLVSAPPKTTDELIALGKKLTSQEEGKYGLVYENGLLYFHAPWLFGFGGTIFNSEGRVDINTPEVVSSLKFSKRLAMEEKILPQEVNGSLVTALLSQGKAAMAITGPWVLADIDASVPIGVAPMPIITGRDVRAKPFMTSEAVYVSARSTKQDFAIDAARWLADEHSASVRLKVGQQPVAYKSVWNALPPSEAPNLHAFKEQLRDTVPTPNVPQMKSVWSPMDNALSLVLHGTSTPEEALKEVATKLEGVLAKVEAPKEEGPFHGFAALMALLSIGALAWAYKQAAAARAHAHLYEGRVTRLAYLYSTPALLAMAVLTFVPFIIGLGMGFFRHTYGRWDFVGLANYRDLLGTTDSRFFYTLIFTVVWTVVNVALHVGIGLALALLLNRPALKGRAIYRVLLIVPWAVPSYITALIWKGMFHPDLGAVNHFLSMLGFDTAGMSWMASAGTAFSANLVTNTWLGFPFMMVVCLGALQSIPSDLYEAARLDGASNWEQFRRITVPLLRPALVPAILLGSVWTFNQFNVVYLVSAGQPDGKTDLLVTEAFRWAFERGPGGAFGLSAAYSTLIFLILLGYTLFVNRITGSLDKALE